MDKEQANHQPHVPPHKSKRYPTRKIGGATDTQSEGYDSQEIPKQQKDGYIAWSTIGFIALAVFLGLGLIFLLFPSLTTVKAMIGAAIVGGIMFAYVWLWAILHAKLNLQNEHYMVTFLYTVAFFIGGLFILGFLLTVDLPFLREFSEFVFGLIGLILLALFIKWFAQKWEETGG